MKLSELLKHVEVLNVLGDIDVEITGVNIDSRRIEGHHLFVAIPGTQTDGHQYIPKAIELGAAAILCEHLPAECKATGPGHPLRQNRPVLRLPYRRPHVQRHGDPGVAHAHP